MKTNPNQRHTNKGFTLIEMIGVLAVIAILAALLVPKIFEAINNAKINNAALSLNTVKTAIADHYAKCGSLLVDAKGAAIPLGPGYDAKLLEEGFLDKPLAVKITTGTNVVVATRSISTLTPGSTVDGTSATGYALAGGATNQVVGATVVEATLFQVNAADARDLSERMDGSELTETGTTSADVNGRVKYAQPVNGIATVYVYLTHR